MRIVHSKIVPSLRIGVHDVPIAFINAIRLHLIFSQKLDKTARKCIYFDPGELDGTRNFRTISKSNGCNMSVRIKYLFQPAYSPSLPKASLICVGSSIGGVPGMG
jgi:hypothetical protein